MQRYFVEENNNKFIFLKDDVFHIVNVMRNKIDDVIEVVSDSGVYEVKITCLDPFDVTINKKIEENHELSGNIRLFICALKGDKTEFVIQKAIELGVKEIVIVQSSRSISKPLEKKESKVLRYTKVVKEASEQSKRSGKSYVLDIIPFKDINKFKADISLIPYEASVETMNNLKNTLTKIKNETINVIVGPEGGFSKDELEYAKHIGFREISLGRRILRSETASLYIVSLLSYFLEVNNERI